MAEAASQTSRFSAYAAGGVTVVNAIALFEFGRAAEQIRGTTLPGLPIEPLLIDFAMMLVSMALAVRLFNDKDKLCGLAVLVLALAQAGEYLFSANRTGLPFGALIAAAAVWGGYGQLTPSVTKGAGP
ncbi:MAG TPA: hypothetical protein VG735_02445 [Caulobacterales bacterium]|jgi:hypothetical protein|nr:hypothetical protein [Caulobacterales bacterium]